MAQRFEHLSTDFVSAIDANLVYIGLADRSAFDRLAAPCHDSGETANGHVLTKRVGNFGGDGVTVIFQHWIKSRSADAIIEDELKEKSMRVDA